MRTVRVIGPLATAVVAGALILLAPASGAAQSHWYMHGGPNFTKHSVPAGPAHWYPHGGKVLGATVQVAARPEGPRAEPTPEAKQAKSGCHWYDHAGAQFNRARPTGPGHWYQHGGVVKP